MTCCQRKTLDSRVEAVAATKLKVLVVEKKEAKKGFKMITLNEKFSCRVRDMVEIPMDENRWKGFMQMIYCWDLFFSRMVR